MANRRRGRGEGSIRERQDGRWEVRVDLGRGPDGKRRRKSAFAATQAAAVGLLKRLAGRQVDGHLLATSTPTVASYLELWVATNTESWRPSTRRGYRRAIDGFIVPVRNAAVRTTHTGLDSALVNATQDSPRSEAPDFARARDIEIRAGGCAAPPVGLDQRRDVGQAAPGNVAIDRATRCRSGPGVSRRRWWASPRRALFGGSRVRVAPRGSNGPPMGGRRHDHRGASNPTAAPARR